MRWDGGFAVGIDPDPELAGTLSFFPFGLPRFRWCSGALTGGIPSGEAIRMVSGTADGIRGTQSDS